MARWFFRGERDATGALPKPDGLPKFDAELAAQIFMLLYLDEREKLLTFQTEVEALVKAVEMLKTHNQQLIDRVRAYEDGVAATPERTH